MKINLKWLCTGLGIFASIWVGSAHAREGSTPEHLVWPEPKDSYLKMGEFVDPRDVRRVIIHQPKREVRLLLNHPNFSEGLFGVREWDYLFNFLTGNGEEYVTCQYKVLFDKDMRVSSTHWKDRQCEDFLKERQPVVVNQTHPITLSADGLFAFGRSGFNDLEPLGRENLRVLAGQLKTGFGTLHSVRVVGYTDRIGSNAANKTLSLARANTVKQYLVAQGISPSLITTQGRGADNPVVSCPGVKNKATIACLMPNRRIEISVNGDK